MDLVVLELASQDTLASALARLNAVSAGRALLRIPIGPRFSVVDLRVLHRAAAEAGIEVALLTADAGLRRRAAEAGISTFRSRAWAERPRWRKPTRPIAPRGWPVGGAEALSPPGSGLFDPHPPSGFRPFTFLRAFARRPSPWWAELGLAAILLLLLGGLLYALAIVIPDATITLTPAAEPIQATIPLTAIQDAGADAEAGIVPAWALSTQVSGEAKIPTSGRRYEPKEKAKGQVVLINRAVSALIVPSGAVVSTATGNNIRFQTTSEASLVVNGRATVPVEALLAGPSGNVRAGTITRVEGALGLSLLVANDTPTAGGTMGQVGVVTDDDKTRLQALLFERLKQQAFEQLAERMPAGGFIPPESVVHAALSPTFTPFEGEIAEELTLNMSVQAVGLVVDTSAGNRVSLARLQAQMPPGTRLISDTLRFIPGSVLVEDARTVRFSITTQGTLLRGADTAAVRRAVLGLSPAEAAGLLAERFALAAEPQVHLGPDWLPYIVPTNLPTLPWRIRVLEDWDAAAQIAGRKT